MTDSNDADLLIRAFRIAVDAHTGQRDKLDEPYILHPIRVMLMGRTNDERIVALLHDVAEDCPDWPLDRLAEHFPSHIVDAIDALTRRSGEDYPTFIERVKASPIATAVKRYDILDNTAPERMWSLDAETRSRLETKYGIALRQLQGMEPTS